MTRAAPTEEDDDQQISTAPTEATKQTASGNWRRCDPPAPNFTRGNNTWAHGNSNNSKKGPSAPNLTRGNNTWSHGGKSSNGGPTAPNRPIAGTHQTQQMYPTYKDQCRSVEEEPSSARGASAYTDHITSSSAVPIATAVASLHINDNDEDFVFRPSCTLVEALVSARSKVDIVGALKDICSATNKERNPNSVQESHTVVAAGGLEAIRERMKAYPDDSEIQEYSCSALWYLTAADDSAVASTGLPAVLKAMKANPRAAAVQHNACGMLRSLAANREICPKIVRAGGALAILIAMRSNPDAAQVQKVACGALASLAKADAALICRQGGVIDIVAAMKLHLADALVQEQACGAIWKLAINHEKGQEQIRRDGAITAVQASMSRHRTNDLVQTYGGWALEALDIKQGGQDC